MNALSELGVDVPESVSVMGFDNIEFDEYLRIPLTTVQMPAYDIGQRAADLLIARIGDSSPSRGEHVILEHTIIERASVAKNPALMPLATAART